MWRKSSEAIPSSPPGESPFPTSGSAPKASSPMGTERPTPPGGLGANSSWVNQGLRFHGVFSGNSDLYLDGELQGKIRLKHSAVSIGPNGRVQGDIDARELIVKGSLNGNVRAGAKTVLGRTGRLRGDISGKCVVIEEGAFFQGRVEMEGTEETRNSAASETPQEGREIQSIASRGGEGPSRR